MGENMLYKEIYYNDKLNKENIIKDICYELNRLSKDKLNIEANFTYIFLENENSYNIYNKNKSYQDNRLDLNMKIYYEGGSEDFLYAYILWFSVNPKKKGIGSYIIKKITAILKLLTNIEVIIIHPKDKEVKIFWIRNRFHEDNTNLLSRRNIKLNTRRILIYELAKTNVDS